MEPAGERVRKVVDPLRLDVVHPQRVVLGSDLLPLFLVGGEAEAARPAQRVAGKPFHPVEGALGPLPEVARMLDAVRLAGDVIGRCAAPEREAAVPAARAFGDSALVVYAYAEPGLCEPERCGTAGYPGADDRHVDATGCCTCRRGGASSSSQYGFTRRNLPARARSRRRCRPCAR